MSLAKLILLLCPLAAKADDPRLATTLPPLPVVDFRGGALSLANGNDQPIVVLAFLAADCPLARLYAPRLQELSRDWKGKNVALIGVFSNSRETPTAIDQFARHLEVSFPLARDVKGQIAQRVGATRTPEVFVFDRAGRCRYAGRIDDQYQVGVQRPKPSRRDLASAVSALLSNQSVEVTSTKAAGCLIERDKTPAVTANITYTQHVASILQDKCVECHRPGEVAPFSLRNYREVVGWADSIREVVKEERMPPWFADAEYGKFQHEGRLSPRDRQIIDEWVSTGCAEGDPKYLPSPRSFTQGWGMSEPDVVFKMAAQPVKVPAEGTMPYLYFTVDPQWTEEKWLCGAEARPGNRAVVHHILVFLKKPNVRYLPGLPGELIAAYAPGMKPTIADKGFGLRAPAGSKIVFQVHYTPNGQPQEDLSFAGFKFIDPKDVAHEVKAGMAINLLFKIPPGASDHVVKASYKFANDALLLGVNPHMHLRGKSFRYEAEYPDGRKETVMNCSKYDFNWQIGYQYVEPLVMPKGTRLHCTAVFDNSENNPSNPDPNRAVTFGEQTWDEMMIGWFFMAETKNRN